MLKKNKREPEESKNKIEIETLAGLVGTVSNILNIQLGMLMKIAELENRLNTLEEKTKRDTVEGYR